MRYKQEAEEQGHSWFWPVIIVIALILIIISMKTGRRSAFPNSGKYNRNNAAG